MTREQRIIETFVEVADTLVEDFDVIEFMHGLAERCVELLDCVEAGLLLADAGGLLRVMASSSERSEALELLQSQNAEGPCYESYNTQQPVHSEDLSTESVRWPKFAPAATERGFRSVQALPMRARGQSIGAVNLFRADLGRMDESDLSLGQGMADVAAIALVQERSVRESRGVVQELQHALHSRVVIEQAKGVLSERAHIDVEEAFSRLRAYARDHNLRLSQIARQVIDGELDANLLTEADRATPASER
jgi:hypothetical protein